MKLLKIIAISFLGLLMGCDTTYYHSANQMRGQPARLTLKDGTVLSGNISVSTFSVYSSVNSVAFAQGTSNQYQTYYTNQIKSLFLNGSTYMVKILQNNTAASNNANEGIMCFVKLVTPTDIKIKLFEYETFANDASGKAIKTFVYYVQLPDDEVSVYNTSCNRFVPNFNEKVSKYVEDCPALANKIKNKEKSLFYAFINGGTYQMQQVWQNIINQYENCN